jgi:phosphatidylglycerophosphate synthase
MSTPALKYAVQDRSILLPYYKRFLIEPVLPIIPASVNPNAITHGGHILNLGALLLLVLNVGMNKRWPFLAVAILVHIYLWCDNADGGHARRTNQCSAKGEFLDHGLDLLNATYIAGMTVMTLGLPPFWSVAAVVVVPAAAAVTYWEQAETGVFQLGLLNQIESICCLTVALVLRAVLGEEPIAQAKLGSFSVPVAILIFVSTVALFGIFRSAMRVAKHGGRLGPFLAPFAFGAAVTVAAGTGALGTLSAILIGAAVFVFLGVQQLTMRIRGKQPVLEHGVLVAAALVAGLAAYRLSGGPSSAAIAQHLDLAAAGVVSLAFGGLALVKALEGNREVERLDRM